jgi:predicted nicotinamide N-methyase
MKALFVFLSCVAIGLRLDRATAFVSIHGDTNHRSRTGTRQKVLRPTRLECEEATLHIVNGITCREVQNELPLVGTVTVLEATADAQEELVDEVLLLDEEKLNDGEGHAVKPRIQKGDPYGSVLWPAAWAVANFMLTKPQIRDELPSLSVLELGTGTGLVSIALAMAGTRRVIATDYEPLALSLTEYAAKNLKNSAKAVQLETEVFDLCDFKRSLPKDVNVVVAADIMYEPKTGSAVAQRVAEALQNGCQVILGDSPGRAGRPAFLQTLNELGIHQDFQDAVGKTCSGPRHDLICGKGSTSVSEVPKELQVAIMHIHPKNQAES